MKINKETKLKYLMIAFAIIGGIWFGFMWKEDFNYSKKSLISQFIGIFGVFCFMIGCFIELYFPKKGKLKQ